MADNVLITPGSGDTVSAEDNAGVKTQRIIPVASAASQGLSIDYRSALSNTAVAVKASAGRIYGYHLYNSNITTAFVQVYNVAQVGVTVGTTTPNTTYALPPNSGVDMMFDIPITYSTAITIAATTTITGGTAPTTGLLTNFYYL